MVSKLLLIFIQTLCVHYNTTDLNSRLLNCVKLALHGSIIGQLNPIYRPQLLFPIKIYKLL